MLWNNFWAKDDAILIQTLVNKVFGKLAIDIDNKEILFFAFNNIIEHQHSDQSISIFNSPRGSTLYIPLNKYAHHKQIKTITKNYTNNHSS